jgi:hypothetical protein
MEHELIYGMSLILTVGLVVGVWIALFYLVRLVARRLFPIIYRAGRARWLD